MCPQPGHTGLFLSPDFPLKIETVRARILQDGGLPCLFPLQGKSSSLLFGLSGEWHPKAHMAYSMSVTLTSPLCPLRPACHCM